jgi:hypothetical protein
MPVVFLSTDGKSIVAAFYTFVRCWNI